MGAWDFFVDIKVTPDDAKRLLQEYNSNKLYQSIFHFGIDSEWLDGEYNAWISSVIDNFLPANHLTFRFLSEIKENTGSFPIKTYKTERLFDFERKSDFINFMYNAWEQRIDLAYRQVGVIILDPKKYDKTRNKLYRKYYKKF